MMLKLFAKYKNMSVVVKATLWFMICGVLQRGISMLTTPIFTRMLSPEQYGQYGLYNSWLSVLTIFCTLRLEKAVFNKGMSKFSDEKDAYTSTMQVTTSLITLIVFIIYLTFRNQINQLTELSTFLTCAMFLELFFHPAISFYNIRQRYDYRYKSVVLITLLYSFLNAGLGVCAVYLAQDSMKGIARILSCVIVATVFGMYVYIYNLKRSHFNIQIKFVKFAVGFNLPLIPHYFSTYILEQSDRLMIQKICGIDKVGIYTVAYNIGLLMKLVTDSLHSAITPWQYEKMKEKKYLEINKVIFPLMLAVVAILIIFMAFAPEIIYIMAGSEYHQAVFVLPPVSGSVFFIMLYGIFSNAEFYYNENKFSSMMTIIGAVLNIVLNMIFISWFGFVAAGYTTLICYTIFAYAHFFYTNAIAKRKENTSIFQTKQIVWPTILIYMGVIIFSLIYHDWKIRYLLLAVLCIVLWIYKKKILELLKVVKKK